MANFSSDNKGTWFYFDDNDDSNGGVCIRVLSEPESRRITNLTTNKTYKFKQGIRYEDIKVDDKRSSKMMWEYIITDWSNVCVDSQELECNNENKAKLIADPNFMSFIVRSMETLNDDIESGKNLAKN